ncbi:MAG: PAS domain S-box protein, partial [Methanothrix sp.]|nr:PAS domain S-box protein [Methanothrix sp.]
MTYEILWHFEADPENNDIDSHADCYVSPDADRMLGLPKNTINDSFEKYLSYVHPEDLPSIQEMLSQAIKSPGNEKNTEHSLLKADGSALKVRSRCYATQQPEGRIVVHGCTIDLNIIGAVQSASEATERRASGEALQESESRFQAIFDNSQDALITLSAPLWNISSANPAALKMFGIGDIEDLKSFSPLDISPETQPNGQKSADRFREMIETALQKGSNYFEWMHRRQSGEQFAATVQLTSMRLREQMLIQATVRDISECKRAQAALLGSEKRLKRAEEIARFGHWEFSFDDDK